MDPATSAAVADMLLFNLNLLTQVLFCCNGNENLAGTSSNIFPSSPATVDIATLTYDGLFDSLTSLQKKFGIDELTSYLITIQLLNASAKNDAEQLIVDTVTGGLERIYNLKFETDRTERTKKLISEKMKLKRLFETSEQREQRLQRMKERYRLQRNALDGDKSDKRRKEFRNVTSSGDEHERAALAKEERLIRLRDYQRRRLLNEKPEQRARRLAKMRENQKLRRAQQLANRNVTANVMRNLVCLASKSSFAKIGEILRVYKT